MKRALGQNTTLLVENQDAWWKTTVHVDDQGTYAGPLWQRGHLTALVKVPGQPSPFFAQKRIESSTDLEWKIQVWGQTIAGSVSNKDDRSPIEGARVLLRSEYSDGGGSRTAFSDDTGQFSFSFMRPGHHTITVSKQDFFGTSTAFDTVDGETEHRADIALEKGIEKKIAVQLSNGLPAGAATIIDPTRTWPLLTEADGIASIPIRGQGTTRLYIVPKEGSFAVASIGRDDPSDPVHITIPSGDATILIRAMSDEGAPLEGVDILVRFNGQMLPVAMLRELGIKQGAFFKTGRDGVVSLHAMPSGRYELWPIYNFAELERLELAPPPPAADVAVQPGSKTIVMSFTRQSRDPAVWADAVPNDPLNRAACRYMRSIDTAPD